VESPLQSEESDDGSSLLTDEHIKARFHARQKALLVSFDELKGTVLLLAIDKTALACQRFLHHFCHSVVT
jgi:hypothetical protein